MQQLGIAFEIARRQRDEGMSLALDRAERDCPSWGDLAIRWLRKYAETHAEFPGWFVTQEADNDPNFPAPENEKAWGAIFTRARRLGILTDSGRTMPHPRRHGCPARVWSSLVYRSAA